MLCQTYTRMKEQSLPASTLTLSSSFRSRFRRVGRLSITPDTKHSTTSPERKPLKNPDLGKLGQGTEINAPLLVMAETKPWTDGKNHRMVRILSTELRAQPGAPSAEEFLNFVADANRKFGLSENYVGKPESFSLGGRTAWKAYFNQQGNTRVWHSLNVAIVAKNHILQFILTSPDEDGLRSLETLLRTVRFRN